VNTIIPYLDDGIRMLGFVSPSHQVSQMVDIIDGLRRKGYAPTVIYNTNCYDCVDTLKTLEDIVNVYLPILST
jgi:putative pyruvate formate lyase activating enzyme